MVWLAGVSMKPRLLDLFCGAGGAAMGYHRAGFEMVGVDISPQPRYPFRFVQADAIQILDQGWVPEFDFYGPDGILVEDFDAIHASPPCQRWTKAQAIRGNQHEDLITPTREHLGWLGMLPWVIENVPGAPLRNPVVLDGVMFGLRTKRERLFETNWPLSVPFLRHPQDAPNAKMGRPPKPHEFIHVVGHFSDVKAGQEALGIDWMTQNELREAIPPAYTQYIGEQLIVRLGEEGAA